MGTGYGPAEPAPLPGSRGGQRLCTSDSCILERMDRLGMAKLLKSASPGIALLALALSPGPSFASPLLTHPTGTALATGAKVTDTNIGVTRFKSTGGAILAECPTTFTTGTVATNSGTHVAIDVESVSTTAPAAKAAAQRASGTSHTQPRSPVGCPGA
jgi:hypothetical protein